MLQTARVIETKGNIAVVEASRSDACAGCAKFKRQSPDSPEGECGGGCAMANIFGSQKEMRATVRNDIGAKVGDVVKIESRSSDVLTLAAFVFLMPVAVMLVFYFIAAYAVDGIFASSVPALWMDAVPFIAGAVGFLLSFAVIYAVEKKAEKSRLKIGITEIVKAA